MRYPTWLAGQTVTAALLSSMLPLEAYKTGNTDRLSTTTFVDDPDLTFDLEANAVYFVEFFLLMGATTAADIKTSWTVPSGAAGLKSVIGPGSAAVDANADNISMRTGVHGFTTQINYSGVRNATASLFRGYEHAIVTTFAAGTCAIRWAQVASDAAASRMSAGSYARAKRVA